MLDAANENRPDPKATPQQGEWQSVERVPGDAASPVVILCDHASNAMPARYDNLGLAAGELERHIAYDIGARGVSVELARAMKAPAVMSHFSRLLIDPNRGEDDPTLIMRVSDGAVIAANATIDEAERRVRLEQFYRPYNRAIAEQIEMARTHGVRPTLVSIHSFTPTWRGVARPWHVGVLWQDWQAPLARRLMDALAGEGDLVVGDNEPYSGDLAGDTLDRHGRGNGLDNVLIEIRQDLIAAEADQRAWGERLARILDDVVVRAPGGRASAGQ